MYMFNRLFLCALTSFCIILSSSFVCAQTLPNYLNQICFGNYSVGYVDTMLITHHEGRDLSSYINVWYPAKADSSKPFMQYRDYWSCFGANQSFVDRYKDILKEIGVCATTKNWREQKYWRREKRLMNAILGSSVNAKNGLVPIDQKFPCIVYHHGNYGSSEDNSIFCEFMASHGFVVVSTNFEWPDFYFGKLEERLSYLREIADFAGSLQNVDADNLIWAGHSGGAQIGIILNSTGKSKFKLILSLDTTVESKNLTTVKRYNPIMDSIITHHSSSFVAPIVLFSTAQIYYGAFGRVTKNHPIPDYIVFKQIRSVPVLAITSKRALEHNNFTSQGIFRSFLTQQVRQGDKKEILAQRDTYFKVIASCLTVSRNFVANKPLERGLDADLFEVEGWNSQSIEN